MEGSEEKKHDGFKKVCIDFASNTTAHGFGQLISNESKIVRFLWVIVILACQLALYFQIHPLYVQYMHRPTRTKVDLKYESTQQFPVVTFCTTNAIKKSLVPQFENDVRYFNVRQSKKQNKRSRNKRSLGSRISDAVKNETEYLKEWAKSLFGNNKNKNHKKKKGNEGGIITKQKDDKTTKNKKNPTKGVNDEEYKDTKKKLKLVSKHLKPKKQKKRIDIPGLVHQDLNDVSKFVITNETKIKYRTKFQMLKEYADLAQSKHENIFQYGHSLEETVTSCRWNSFYDCTGSSWWKPIWHWRYGNCYTFNSTDGGRRLHVNSVGPDNGLQVTLGLNDVEIEATLTDSKGVILHIGEEGSRIEPYLNGYNLSPNYIHYISLTKIKTKRADPFRNKSCVQHSSFDLGERLFSQRYVNKYSLQLCREICLVREQIKMCDCTSYWLPSLNSNNTCGWEDSECVNTLIELAIKDELPCMKKCRLPCDESNYEREVSSRGYTGSSNRSALKVVISFKTLETKITENVEYYFIENLLSDIGGQLGLFSGISALTAVEIIFLIGNLLFLFVQYFKTNKQKDEGKILMSELC